MRMRGTKETRIKYMSSMLKARKDGRKTQTRRLIDPQPEYGIWLCCYSDTGFALAREDGICPCTSAEAEPPFGNRGDTLIICDEHGNDTGGRDMIKRVWVERVQGISPVDAWDEGITCDDDCPKSCFLCPCNKPVDNFVTLWNSIYPGSWDRSDWVWCYEFEVIK